MAKILLNIELNSRQAQSGLDELKKSLSLIVDSLKDVKPNKDLTAQINALATYYKNLSEAAKNAAAQTQKNSDADAKAAIQAAKVAKEEANAAAAIARKQKAEIQAAEAAERHAAAQEKRAQATEKTADAEEKAEKQVRQATIAFNNMLASIASLEKKSPKGTFDDLKTAIKYALDQVKGLDTASEEYIETAEKLNLALGIAKQEFSRLKAEVAQSQNAIKSLGESFGDLIGKLAGSVLHSALNTFRKGITDALSEVGETLVKTENAVIELNRVLDDPQPAQEISNRLYNLAYQYGSTFENASTIAANFARAGRSWNESLQATEAALLAMNVAELNATEASDGLLSVIAQFDMEASDLVDVVDKLNKTADKNPVSTQKLLQAIQRAGSAAKNANVSFDQTLGLITAISEATNRSGQNIGTAINSLIQYSTKKIDAFSELSAKSAEMVEKFKLGLVSIVDVWQQVAEDIHNDKESRDKIIESLGTDDLEELSSTLHDELGDLVSEIDGVYNVANTYRKNYFIALLDNMDRFMDVQTQLTDYQGYSQEENAKYMETYTAKVNQLKDAWHKLANDEQGILAFKKDLVDLGLGAVTLVEKLGGIKTTVAEISALLGAIAVFFKAKDISEWIVNLGQSITETGRNIMQLPYLFDQAAAARRRYAEAAAMAASAEELADLAQTKAAASAAAWQAALGWISLAVAAVSALVMAFNSIRAAQEKAREEAIEYGKETTENAKQIAELRKELQKLNPDSEEYREIESQIVQLLGDKKAALEDLIPVTEKYRDKVKELTDAELAEALISSENALDAATKNASKAYSGAITKTRAISHSGGYDIYGDIVSARGIEEEYQAYERTVQKLTDLKKTYARLVAEGNEEEAASYKKRIDAIQKWVDAVSNGMQEYQTAVDNHATVSRINLDNSIEAITASMQNIPATARRTQAELQAIAEENGMTLEEVREAFEVVGTGSAQAAEAVEESLEEVTDSFDKAGASAEEFTTYITNTVGGYAAAADAIQAVTAAQKEYAETGKLSVDTLEKLAKLDDDWIQVLFDENGAVELNTTAVWERLTAQRLMLEEQGYAIESTKEETDVVEKATERLKDYNAQIDEVQSALSTLNDIQKEYDETGALSIDTFQKLLDLGGEYLELLIDENGQLSLNTDAVETLKQKKLDLIEQLIRENTAQYALSLIQEKAAEKEHEVGTQAANAALKIGEFVAQLYNLKGQSSDAVIYLDALHQSLAQIGGDLGIALSDADLAEISSKTQNYYAGLESAFGYVNTSSGWTSSSSSSSSSKSTKDKYLETLKSAVSLRESELTLMQHQGATQDEQIAKIKQIQAGIAEEADYLRSIGASQEDINKLSSEWWTWQEKINKFAEDNAKAAEKAAEEEKKAAEEAQKAAEKAAEEAEKAAEAQRKAAEEAIKAETSRLKQIVSDDKARLNLMEKQGKSVSERVEKMKEIQSHLHDEAEWLRQIKAEQAEIDALSAEWWDWQEKILKLYQETLDAQKQIELDAIQKTIDGILKEIDLEEQALELEEKRLAVDEQRLNLEEAIAKAKLDYIQTVLSDYITALSDAETLEEKQRAVAEAREKLVQAQREAQAKSIIDAFKAEKEVKSDTLSLEEKRLAVEKARQALIDAENNRTTRVLNEATGQWEYQANARDVQNAKDSLKSAVDALNAYVEEAAWNEVAEAVENGSVSEAEVLEILSKWAKEAYGNDSPEFVSKIQTAFRKAMGTAASPDSVSGQISAVDSAVKSLNDYLKQEAVKELKAYIAAGNTDFSGMRSILDKWLSMGEGSELYSWRDGLLSTVTDAIRSGYYDDTKVQSQVQAVENAVESLHDYLRSSFIREIEDIVRNGTADQITAAIERWSNEFDLSDTDRDWAERLASAKSDYERTEAEWNSVSNGSSLSDEEKRAIVQRMKANSEEWWIADEARRKELADLNYVLGTSMGWHRKDDGAWYDEYDRRLYDKGGVLRGTGGIKGTDRPEIVLDPELTSQILKPGSEAQFRAFADALHLMFERGGRRADDMPVIRNPAVTDSHNTSYTVNGIPIGQSMAERYTIAELFRTMPLVGAN